MRRVFGVSGGSGCGVAVAAAAAIVTAVYAGTAKIKIWAEEESNHKTVVDASATSGRRRGLRSILTDSFLSCAPSSERWISDIIRDTLPPSLRFQLRTTGRALSTLAYLNGWCDR